MAAGCRHAAKLEAPGTMAVLIDRTVSVSGKRAAIYPIYFQENVASSLSPGERLLIETISDKSTLSDPPSRVVDTTLPDVAPPPWSLSDDFQSYLKRCRKVVDPQVQDFEAAISKADAGASEALASNHFANFTYILDGIEDASAVLKHRNGPQKLIIFTDGIEDSEEYGEKLKFDSPDFWKTHSDRTIISELKERNRIPDLHGVAVYVIGAAAPSPEMYRRIAQFWESYFREAGVSSSSLHYGHNPSWEEKRFPGNLAMTVCPPNY